jgi:hypothetical protein
MNQRQIGTDWDGPGGVQHPLPAVIFRQVLEHNLQQVADTPLDAEQPLRYAVRVHADVCETAQMAALAAIEIDLLNDGVHAPMLAQTVHDG